ncbi:MAG: NAD(P)/FAD-dependent oxidoreductase, partial [Alphaproteobacteria bacterium]
MDKMKTEAQVVIIGGGVVGCSALYHLAKRGVTDTLLLERDELTSGSTWHAAGNCPTFAGSWNITKYQSYGNRLYARLAEEVDYPMNYHVTGSIRLAHTEERMDEFRHAVGMCHAQGLDIHMMTVEDIKEKMPTLETHDILGGLWDPYDGDIDPSQATQAFAKGARDLGATIQRFTPVTGVAKLESGKWLVKTDKGDVTCDTVVNAAGYFGAEVAAMI